MPLSSTTTGQAPALGDAAEKSTIISQPSTQPPAFKLRPRSSSQDAPDISGLGEGAPSISALKPRQQGIATVSPDGPAYPSSSGGDGLPPSSPSRKPPPPAFASFFAKSSAHKCASPTKKQRLDFSPDGSPSSIHSTYKERCAGNSIELQFGEASSLTGCRGRASQKP
ncbi:hypothetical protein ACHAXT_000625 [Thalassiosira profunda]